MCHLPGALPPTFIWQAFHVSLLAADLGIGVSAFSQNGRRLGARLETDPHLRNRFGRAESVLNDSVNSEGLILLSHAFDTGRTLRECLGEWVRYYNQQRGGHSSLHDRTPDEVYYGLPHPYAEAA